jgi:hypothetical protein
VRQFNEWGNTNEHILIAVARYLGANSPTERATLLPRTSRAPHARR